MKRHKHKDRSRWDPEPCTGCQWYHEWFGVCCNGESNQRGDVSWRCERYVAGDPLPGVADEDKEKQSEVDQESLL
jgi:hypothetical protein